MRLLFIVKNFEHFSNKFSGFENELGTKLLTLTRLLRRKLIKGWLVWINIVFSLQSHLFELAIRPSDSKHDIDIKTHWKIKSGRAKLVFSKRCASKIWGGSVRSDLKKTRLLHLGNVEKQPHPQFSAQRAPEG